MSLVLYDRIDFSENIPVPEIIEESMTKWIEKNVSSGRAIKLTTVKLEIYIDGKKTGWFIDSDTYNVTSNGIGYNTTPYAKLQCYDGYEEGLYISK